MWYNRLNDKSTLSEEMVSVTTETEAIKTRILSTGQAEILLEENDFLIVKWLQITKLLFLILYLMIDV